MSSVIMTKGTTFFDSLQSRKALFLVHRFAIKMNTLINTHSLKIMVDSSIFEEMSRSGREVMEARISPVEWTLQLRKEMISICKLEKYTPTKFANTDSTYNKRMADNAVCFINCLKRTKGQWYGQPFDLERVNIKR